MPLDVAASPDSPGGLPADDLKAAVSRMKEIQRKDEVRHATAEAKSTLESYILSVREKVDADEGIAAVSTEEQREAFKAQLTEAEDWLYMDGSDGGADEFRAKLAELQKVGAAMEKRASERTRRPEAVAKARAFAELARKVVAAWNTSKPHINETEKEGLLDKVDGLLSWLDEAEAKQARRRPSDFPQTLRHPRVRRKDCCGSGIAAQCLLCAAPLTHLGRSALLRFAGVARCARGACVFRPGCSERAQGALMSTGKPLP